MGAIQFDALLVNYEHGDLSAILGGIEDLAKIEKDPPSGHKQDWKQRQDVNILGTDGGSKYLYPWTGADEG